MLEYDKIFVDSRFKTTESGSNSDFKFELPDDLSLPNNARCYIDDITIPVSGFSVEAGMNDRLYVRLKLSATGKTDEIIILDPQNYDIESFRDMLQEKLNQKFPNRFAVEGNKRTNLLTIKITNSNRFEIWTDDDLKKGYTSSGNWSGEGYYPNNLMSFNNSLKNTDGTSGDYYNGMPYLSGFVDFLNIHNVYLHSNLSRFDCMTAVGRSNIVKKICITTSWGYLQNDSVVMINDFIDVSNRTFKTLEFSLRNVYGNVVPLHGGHISFTLRFTIGDSGQ